MNVKINNKMYEVPQLGFKEMVKMEKVSGTSLITMFQSQQIFSLAEAFISVIVGCGKEEADRLAEQHVLGGGSLEGIYEAFAESANESGFFRKVLGLEDEKKESTKKTAPKTE